MKHALTFFLLMGLSFLTLAQPAVETDEKKHERIERLKRAFISEKLDLTVAEAEKFWPVYNEYSNKRTETRKALRSLGKGLREKNAGEKETLLAIEQMSRKRKEEVDLDEKFLLDNIAILGASKVQKLMDIDEDFRRELKEEFKEKREEKQKAGGGDGGSKKP